VGRGRQRPKAVRRHRSGAFSGERAACIVWVRPAAGANRPAPAHSSRLCKFVNRSSDSSNIRTSSHPTRKACCKRTCISDRCVGRALSGRWEVDRRRSRSRFLLSLNFSSPSKQTNINNLNESNKQSNSFHLSNQLQQVNSRSAGGGGRRRRPAVVPHCQKNQQKRSIVLRNNWVARRRNEIL
jgi:hypothetical protein